MRIPPRLNDLLQKDDELSGVVRYALSVVRPWFEDNKLVFFPEYTDHGPKHIQEVFDTAEALIAENAWSILRAEDAATLVLSIILHDCAMHLSEDGFISLINNGSRPCNEGFRDKPWSQLWNEFMAEARRFNERKLKALFDDIEPVRTVTLDPLLMTKRDRLLIGEFLRRHHPRLAHEIALTGVPGPFTKGLSLGDIPQDIKDLSGIVARSHGLDLRVAIDYLNNRSKWGARRTTGVHVTYLMVLVRIADYLQIHSTRAPKEVLHVRSLRSPVSRGEWNAHAAIKDIHQETDDPEALWVEAVPKDIRTYLKLKYLLNDIQRELDESWAVLGEVYGPKEELRGLGVKLRRIKSNLQNTASFAEQVTYVPCQAALHTAGVDLLKLLIAPLYGDKPEVGIRELLQNAVDACRELQDYLDKNPELRNLDLQEQSGDVVIAVKKKEDGTTWVTVSDRGIGMTVDTILNYFLKVGASFRNSYAWRKLHEDEHGQMQVLRSGRFGIGILAGFLLGNEIHVSTRHVSALPHEGVSFSCSMEEEHIQLNRTNRPIGTTVSIQIYESIYDSLVPFTDDSFMFFAEHGPSRDWDWYCLAEPSVHRVIPKRLLEQGRTLPSENSDLPPEWRRTRHPDYSDIQWSFLDNYEAWKLTCNGIAIADLNARDVLYDDYADSIGTNFERNGIRCPKLSIFDPHGNLPLNLQRTNLSVNRLPFEEELIKDICYDILAYLLVRTPKNRPLLSVPDSSLQHSTAPYLYHKGVERSSWIYFTSEGVALLAPWNIQKLQTPQISAASSHLLLEVFEGESFQPYLPYFNINDLFKIGAFERETGGWNDRQGWVNFQGYRIIINNSAIERHKQQSSHWETLKEPGKLKNANRLRHGNQTILYGQIEWENDEWILLRRGVCPPLDCNVDKLLPELVNEPNFLMTFYPSKEVRRSPSQIEKAWRNVIRLPFIPYNIKKRRERLANAYEQLASYLRPWE